MKIAILMVGAVLVLLLGLKLWGVQVRFDGNRSAPSTVESDVRDAAAIVKSLMANQVTG